MGPKKRLKTPKYKSVKVKCPRKSVDLTNLSETEHVLPNISTENLPELYFSLLPNEVLLYIYQYLSPTDLLSLSQLGQRYNELTSDIKKANFSSCRRASPEQVSSYFSRLRVKHIQKLNFNYNIFVKPCVLVQLICRCKNLTELSIVECGINYNYVFQILENCAKLEELAWNPSKDTWALNARYPNMKTVYLFYSQDVQFHFVCVFMLNFPGVKNIFLNLASDYLSAIPFLGLWLMSDIPKLLRGCVTIIHNFAYGVLKLRLNQIREFDLNDPFDNAEDNPGENRHGKIRSHVSKVYNRAPYLQIRSMEEDILLLSSGPYNAYSSVAVLLTPEIVHLSESLAKSIEEVAGDKLKHLSLQNGRCNISDDGSISMSVSEITAVCMMLEKICLSCQNITVLNIAMVHFSIFSPFRAICQLQHLRTLNIPSCCFKKPSVLGGSSHPDSQQYICQFEEVVNSCQKVENFALICCRDDIHRVNDFDVNPIKKWKELKHLSIYKVIFRSCIFLRGVAVFCKQLESLSLISVASASGCIFTSDVIYVLKAARNLSFIRINVAGFNPMYERFWDSIGEAVNLEGICIIVRNKIPIVKRTIIEAIKKLKYLHLFHFHHSRAPENLYIEVK